MRPTPKELSALFDFPVCLSMRAPDNHLAELSAAEKALTEKMGSARLAGFTTGRLAAQEALLQLGVVNTPVLIGEKRRPIWPDNVRGSISHCKDECLAVVADARHCNNIGIDVEQLKGLEKGVRNIIMTSAETEHLASLPQHLLSALPADTPLECVFFSLKESIFKCLNPLTDKWIEFHQANIVLHADYGVTSIELDSSVHNQSTINGTLVGRYLCTGSHVFSAVTLVNNT